MRVWRCVCEGVEMVWEGVEMCGKEGVEMCVWEGVEMCVY